MGCRWRCEIISARLEQLGKLVCPDSMFEFVKILKADNDMSAAQVAPAFPATFSSRVRIIHQRFMK